MKDFLKFVLFVAVIIVIAKSCGQSKQSSNMDYRSQDPQAFKDAAAMFNPVPIDNLSQDETNRLLDDLSQKVTAGKLPDDPECLQDIQGLENAYDYNAIYDRLLNIAALSAEKIKGVSSSQADAGAVQLFSAANEFYKKGDFATAVTKYRELLQSCPNYPDARNNLGLALMHQGQNVVPFLQFEIVRKLMPDYYGASLNQTVVLERMGLAEKSYQLSAALVEQAKALPMAYYNLGWLENSRGMYGEAQNHFDQALKLNSNYGKSLQASVLNKTERGDKLSKSELKALPGNDNLNWNHPARTQAEVKNNGVQLMNGAAPLATLAKGNIFPVAQTSGDWIGVYSTDQGVKHLGWIYNSDVKLSVNKLFSWWWWWLVIILILYINNMIGAFNNCKEDEGTIGLLAIITILVFGIVYGVFFYNVHWLGWSFAALGILGFLYLGKAST
ncbi:MAG TPA: tetratricopeptide repeat protein [Syntrophomonadaceae bacterium]|nr:tetratricopeptide repeat protein [Syntrophomonadaceae bacterium]